MATTLTGKQRRFVSAYLGPSEGNATDAARRAGYSGTAAALRVTASRLLTKANVRAAIDAKLDAVGLETDEILALLTDHATSSVDDFIKIDKRGRVTIDLNRARTRGRLHCARKVKRGKFGIEIELYDAQGALRLLAQYRGLLGDGAKDKGMVPYCDIPDDEPDIMPRNDAPGTESGDDHA